MCATHNGYYGNASEWCLGLQFEDSKFLEVLVGSDQFSRVNLQISQYKYHMG